MRQERPILFNQQMVKAILDGNKTQTRRFIDPRKKDALLNCPLGNPGDLLWVRETWRAPLPEDNKRPSEIDYNKGVRIFYEAGGSKDIGATPISGKNHFIEGKKRPSLHMPYWACRLFLEITSVRVEYLQDISNEDAIAEGIIDNNDGLSCSQKFESLWKDTYNNESWDENPLVYVIDFKIAKK